MNIAMLVYEFPPFIIGGLGSYGKNFVEHLVKRDSDVYVFCHNTGKMPVVEKRDRLTIIRPFMKKVFPRKNKFIISVFLYNILSFFKLSKLCRKNRVDIITVHDWLNCPAGFFAGILFNKPVVFHVHNTFASMTAKESKKIVSYLIKIVEGLSSKLAAKIIVPTEAMCRILADNGWTKSRIEIITHGSDKDFMSQAGSPGMKNRLRKLDALMNVNSSTVKLLYVGRLVPEKGVLKLIEALPMVMKKHENIKLIIAGKADMPTVEEEIRLLISRLSISDNIHIYYKFLCFEDILCHYLYSDICVFPSLYEPFGLVALEAMAMRKPLILGSGYCKATFDDAQNKPALFVDGGNPSSIAEGILAIIENSSMRNEIVENAYKYVLPRFSWDKTVDKTLEVYQKIIKERRWKQKRLCPWCRS